MKHETLRAERELRDAAVRQRLSGAKVRPLAEMFEIPLQLSSTSTGASTTVMKSGLLEQSLGLPALCSFPVLPRGLASRSFPRLFPQVIPYKREVRVSRVGPEPTAKGL